MPDVPSCQYSPSQRELYPKSFTRRAVLAARDMVYSTDGTCGPNHGNTLCDPNSKVYTGTCCSQYGWCGNTPAHCGTGCISGCTGASSSSVSAPAPSSTGGTTRNDGRCGSAFGGAVCDPAGPYGGCCSSYGYCGNTEGHCLAANGCQSGCSTPATSTGPTGSQGPTSSTAPRPDGRCGTAFGGATCDPKGAFGGCCSSFGFVPCCLDSLY